MTGDRCWVSDVQCLKFDVRSSMFEVQSFRLFKYFVILWRYSINPKFIHHEKTNHYFNISYFDFFVRV